MDNKIEENDLKTPYTDGVLSRYTEIVYKKPIIVLKNPKTELYKKTKELITGQGMLWYHCPQATSNPHDKIYESETQEQYSNTPFFSHCVIERATGKFPCSKIASYYSEQMVDCVLEILDHNQININNIFRMNVNMTYYVENPLYTMPHIDHDYPHNNMLIYFNDVSGGEVKVYKDNKWHIHKPNEDDVILFSGLHCHRTPQKPNQFRTALVTTFI